MLLANSSILSLWITLLLAVAAALGYVLGRRQVRDGASKQPESRGEIMRALTIAQELEAIAGRLCTAFGAHLPAIENFQRELEGVEEAANGSWQELCERADELLKPTLRLNTEISHGYAEILRQMAHLSSFAELRADPLTGINNRRAFDETLSAQLTELGRYPAPLSIAMIDVDCFKQVNDKHGHLQGDRVLQELANGLKSSIRQCDFLARYGGEEFVVLMPRTEIRPACNLAERIRAAVAGNTAMTVSIGLAEWLPGDTASTLVSRADAAMYAAKENGRNRIYRHEGASGRIVGADCKAGPQQPETAPLAACPSAVPIAASLIAKEPACAATIVTQLGSSVG